MNLLPREIGAVQVIGLSQYKYYMGLINGYVKKNKERARNILAWYYLSKGFCFPRLESHFLLNYLNLQTTNGENLTFSYTTLNIYHVVMCNHT